MPSQSYYRPYLTGEELDAIVLLFSNQPHTEFINKRHLLSSYKKINDLKEKKDRGQAFVALTTKGSIKEQFVDSLDLDGQSANRPAQLTATEKRLAAWTKFKINPANCSVEEIDLIKTYRWENGLMTETEEELYEASLFKV